MQEGRSATLGLVDRIKLLPSLIDEHGVLQNTSRMDESCEVGSGALDEGLHRLLLAHVALRLFHVDAQRLRQRLDLLPVRHVLIADLHGPGEELDAELLATLLLCCLQQPESHHQPQGAVAARDANNTVLRQLPFRMPHVRSGRHLPQHIATLVEEPHRVVAKGGMTENLRRQVWDPLRPQCPLGVYVLNGARHFVPGRVASAEEVGIGDETQTNLLMDLSFLCKDVGCEHTQPLTSGAIVRKLFEDCQENLHHSILLLVHIFQLIAGWQVDAQRKDDEIPGAAAHELQHLLIRVLFCRLGLHALAADAPGRRLSQDVLAVPVAVGEDQDIFRLYLRVVHRWPLASIKAAQGIGCRLQIEVNTGACRVLQGQMFWEPLNRPARVASMLRRGSLHKLCVGRLDVPLMLLPKHRQGRHRHG
mmetsp:Transcript_9535/g.22621  ORF Transcript_9535/g.22621 Transcript_9535/m.22621 type:complete len:419 (+) Transcript_9535:601-1857(+)